MKLTSAAAVAILAYCSSVAAYSEEYDNALYARDAYADNQDIYARDADAWAEPDDDDLDLYARDAEPDYDDSDLYARDAEAMPLEDELDLHAREIYAREAEAAAAAEAEAEAEAWAEPEAGADDDDFDLHARSIHPRDAYLAGYEDGLQRRSAHEQTTFEKWWDDTKTSGAFNAGRNVGGQAGQAGKAVGDQTKGLRGWLRNAWKTDTTTRNHPGPKKM